MLIDSTSTTDILKFVDMLRFRPAEVRTAADIRPPLEGIDAPGIATNANGSANGNKKPSELKMSPWLADTMEVISIQRDRMIEGRPLLDDAEKLAALIVVADPKKRPQLNILSDGRPSFATSVKDFYIHLTIDRPGRLTWFATANDQEYFGEDVPFDGRRIPQEIRQLLSA